MSRMNNPALSYVHSQQNTSHPTTERGPLMNIGAVAERANLPPKTIRYYEDIGLVKPQRGSNGYRSFCQDDLNKLSFIGRARSLGFTIEECRVLLALYEKEDRASSDVKKLAEQHLGDIDRKIAELQSMRATLATLVESCNGDHRPNCPILEDLATSARKD